MIRGTISIETEGVRDEDEEEKVGMEGGQTSNGSDLTRELNDQICSRVRNMWVAGGIWLGASLHKYYFPVNISICSIAPMTR